VDWRGGDKEVGDAEWEKKREGTNIKSERDRGREGDNREW
jgi:hypothetical protein